MQSAILFSLIFILAASSLSTFANPAYTKDPHFSHPRFPSKGQPKNYNPVSCDDRSVDQYLQYPNLQVNYVASRSTPGKKVYQGQFKDPFLPRIPPSTLTVTIESNGLMTVQNDPDLNRLPQTQSILLVPFASQEKPHTFAFDEAWWMNIQGLNQCSKHINVPFGFIAGFKIWYK